MALSGFAPASDLTLWGATLLVSLGAAGLAHGFGTGEFSRFFLPAFEQRRLELERSLTFLRVGVSAKGFLGAQGVGSAVVCALGFDQPFWFIGAFLLIVLPPTLVRRAERARVQAIEAQIEGFMTILGRALSAVPSLGEAIEACVEMSDAPLREELEVVVSEMHLGTPLAEALDNWEKRVGSRVLSLALGTLRVGRQTGGRLGEVLKTAAESLREMNRLEGVVRTKTAEGRAQALVISIVPFPLFFLVRWGDPNYFRAFETSALGHVLVAVAVGMWLAAILAAKKILAVRI